MTNQDLLVLRALLSYLSVLDQESLQRAISAINAEIDRQIEGGEQH